MNLSNFSLKGLRQRDITLIILVLTIILAVLWYFYMFTPTRDRISELDIQIDSLAAEVRQGETAQRNLPELEESLAKAKQARDDFLSELPLESDVSRLLDSLRLTAADSELNLTNINKGGGGNNAIEDVRSIGFSLATTGSYNATMSFLSELQSLKRFTKIQSVNLSTQDDGTTDDPQISTSFDFNVFVYTGDAGANP